jgi:hypothetical protein
VDAGSAMSSDRIMAAIATSRLLGASQADVLLDPFLRARTGDILGPPRASPVAQPGPMTRGCLIPRADTPRRLNMIGIPLIGSVRQLGRVAAVLAACGTLAPADDLAPEADERQLPRAMHSAMSEQPAVTVGRTEAPHLDSEWCPESPRFGWHVRTLHVLPRLIRRRPSVSECPFLLHPPHESRSNRGGDLGGMIAQGRNSHASNERRRAGPPVAKRLTPRLSGLGKIWSVRTTRPPSANTSTEVASTST